MSYFDISYMANFLKVLWILVFQEGFNYHHAESGYVMLTHWLPDDLCMLPGSPSHQIGVGAFVINDKREVPLTKLS